MRNVYVVLPFTNNYGRPVAEKMKVFNARTQAIQYADKFECVELTTTKLI